MGDITGLIDDARAGDREAFDRLFEALYPELRRVAHLRLAGNARDTLMGTTMLVNECYLKFAGGGRLGAESRSHFLAYSATVMRSIIVDLARASRSQRRGAGAEHVPVDDDIIHGVAQSEDEILDVDEALRAIERLEPRLVRVVEMRYFGGLKDIEIASALGLTDRTVRRDWEKARLLLAEALRA